MHWLEDAVFTVARRFKVTDLFDVKWNPHNSEVWFDARKKVMDYYDYHQHPLNSHWRFDKQLCDIDDPTQLANREHLVSLFKRAQRTGAWASTFQQWYIWELCRKDGGSIAFIKDQWLHDPTPLEKLRVGCLWDPQFALNDAQYDALGKLKHNDWDWSIHKSQELLAVGSTRILRRCALPRKVGHEYRQGLIVTLPELIWWLGRDFTAMEIMHWWSRSQKLAVKREWPWGTKDVFGSMLAMGSS